MKKPNPISIIKARGLLAKGYNAVPCELAGTAGHRFAWMVEKSEVWLAPKGVTTTVTPPDQPVRDLKLDAVSLYRYQAKMEDFRLYNHLVKEGTTKMTEWLAKTHS